MFVRITTAAVLALAASSTALAAGTDGKITIRYTPADPNDPAGVQRVIDRFTVEAQANCLITGSLIANQKCVDEFVAEAIGQVKRHSLRAALNDAVGIESGAVAMATID